MLNVFRCWHLRRLLELFVVLPQILEFVRCLHFWTALGTAEFGDRAIEEVDLIVEINHYCPISCLLPMSGAKERTIDCQPLILILAFW
jgi:hypothetical protein